MRRFKARFSRIKRRTGDIFSRAISAATSFTRSPIGLTLVLLATVLFISEQKDKEKGILGTAITNWKKDITNAQIKDLLDWINKKRVQTIAFIGFAGSIVGAAPRKYQLAAIGIAFGVAYWLPEANNFEYIVQAIALSLFFRLKKPYERLAIIGITALAYGSGYIFTNIKR